MRTGIEDIFQSEWQASDELGVDPELGEGVNREVNHVHFRGDAEPGLGEALGRETARKIFFLG